MGYTFGVGREAPRFTLRAADGSEIELAQYRGDWLPVIVFFRHDDAGAADRLAALGSAADQLWGFRGQVLGVAAAAPAQLAALDAQAGPFSFPLLGDQDGKVARTYDAWNAAAGCVRDVTYIVDKSGKIVWVGQGDEAARPAVLTAAFRDIAR